MPESAKDEDLLQGAWEVAEVRGLAGEDADDAMRGGYWFRSNRVVIGDDLAAWEWPYRLDMTSSPRRLAIWSEDPNFAFVRNAAYDVSEQQLVLCFSLEDRAHFPDTLQVLSANGLVSLRLVRSTKRVPI